MTEQTSQPSQPSQNQPQAIIDSTPSKETSKTVEEEALAFLREIQENVGQMAELTEEEKNLVIEFFSSLVKILKPFGKTLEISVTALPKKYGELANKAYLYLTGELILVYRNGDVEILDLNEPENRDILEEILGDIMMRLKTVIDTYRTRTEKRVKFLMSITTELQKVAKVFSEE
jgi:hypothetical protein